MANIYAFNINLDLPSFMQLDTILLKTFIYLIILTYLYFIETADLSFYYRNISTFIITVSF